LSLLGFIFVAMRIVSQGYAMRNGKAIDSLLSIVVKKIKIIQLNQSFLTIFNPRDPNRVP